MSEENRDEKIRYATNMASLPSTYAQDGLVSVHNHEFMNDPAYVAAYARGVKAAGMNYGWYWRVHIGLWAASVAKNLRGDFVECGVNAGFMSSSIMHHLEWNSLDRKFYLLDTFSGLDDRYVTDVEISEGVLEKNTDLIRSGFYITDVTPVEMNFSEWSNVRIIQGSIPDTLPLVVATEIAFLHIDLNCAPPEIAAVEYFWEKLVKGAMVLLDDYAYDGYRQQKLAMDVLAKKLGVSIASLPTGQGLFIKP